ncbi:DUF736 domain-containing protein [Rhizobium rhizogenes]|uniref:DUF736 domain-containing protein n=1 Tax=Rhizobium rhizogenes TaxID=359 RepID=A0AA95AHW2_RHIRH|nr:DUF736 family protein [Agrobacterium tumefaciens]OMP69841.1 hypothetical protein BV900_22975 [Agrobacterium tumefaciens]TRA88367.1 DUF736 domain-containing protein [Rhizobium rhizogenes]
MTCLIEERLRLDRSPATASPPFFPCDLRSHSSRSKKAVSRRPPLHSGPLRMRSDRPRSNRQSSRTRWSRPDQTERITTMAIIGEFTTNGNTILGHVRTLTVSMKARLNPIERTSRDAPDFRIMSGAAEVGAAWSQVSGDGEPYISVKLDDPSFPAPINAALWPTEREGDYTLVWNRPKRDA